ncbi:Transposable element P [Labeo rohita]|uniref:Transposable element P n=1 Tax=Labeo rohita TaxID=84645 RepID=A0A498LXS5_LABRO|nr:Transposable element P [Labeo rohita]
MECLVFICDQAAGNRAMLTRLGVTKEQPFFSVDGIRVFCLWDPPHLIKNIRNNWRRHGFVLDGNEITWDILEDLYAYDSHQEIRLCCRLTKKHVHLPPFASMRVRLATQVLSHSVAVGIKTLTDIKGLTGQHQQNYLEAARFCENFNGLFDCFNSKQLKDSHKLKCAISDASAHFPFFDKCLEWLPRLKLVGANSNKKQIPCVEGWQHNILCLKMLWSDLRQRHQVSFLLTNRLIQDCLENAFSSIRARGGNRDKPDSVQFECEYRAVATGLMFSNSEKTNCEQDLDALLLQFSTYVSHESPQVIVDPKSIMEEHGYYRVATDFDMMDCTEVRERENFLVCESEKSGQVVSKDQLSTFSNSEGECSARNSYLQEHQSSDGVLSSDINPPPFDHDGNVLVYIAGYIADKVVGKFADPEGPCKECKVLSTHVPTDPRYTFLKDKQYTDLALGEKGLKVPRSALVDLVVALEANFRKHINGVVHSVGLGKKLFTSGMEVVRAFTCEVKCGKRSTEAEFVVIKGKGESLLGKEIATKLGALRIGLNIATISDMANQIQEQYPVLFRGVGKLNTKQIGLYIDETVTPIAQPIRRIPFHLREAVERKI